MLIDFKVANFRSIAEPLTFSMQGSKASKASIETGSNAVPYLLRAAAIFGANGSGKTNLLMAADVLQRLLSGEITARPDPGLADDHRQQPRDDGKEDQEIGRAHV